jgi:sulfite oxidase
LNSAICVPAAGAKLDAGSVAVSGYALAPGVAGRTIAAVEVSADGGKQWKRAKFTSDVKPLCWCLWAAEVAVSPETRELIVRATDSAGNMQPQTAKWNKNGYLFDGWYQTPVRPSAARR